MARRKAQHVLSHFKVLDLTEYLSGPMLTRIMAEMGAEVIKIEPPGGDKTRQTPWVAASRSAYNVQQNRGKKSVCLDLKTPAGLTIVKDLLPKVDVLAENFSPGVMTRLGLGYKTVKSINPAIVMCSISSFGQTGPLAPKVGFDFIAASYAGVISMMGFPDGPPVMPGLSLGDSLAAITGVGAVLAALLYREKTGKGQHLDISLLDSYFQCFDLAVQMISASGGDWKPVRYGTRTEHMPPIGLFKSDRHYICIMAQNNNLWTRLCTAMGRPELASDARFGSTPKRTENGAEVYRIVGEWIASTPEDEALRLLEQHRVPAAPVLSVQETMNHPHMRERRTVRTVTDRILGEFQIPGSAYRFSEFPEDLALDAPLLGEHNTDVLSEYLGYSEKRVAELEAQGVLQRAPK
ncbi:MAG TPA: CaiB/BaiF CoA-transferase family protein [Candidatus Binataceae bacterium]|jgi:crotonobetainyl-CoA:carnitine CoA-transferase CaiB-like acyl-CoA transferase|nr:CaiB/BaiF CoA-transferase family protein [Candidatus Binataceae bacterium]